MIVRALALLLFLIACAEIIFDGTGPFGRFGPLSFAIFGFTVWCFSTMWDHAVTPRRGE